jgi:hypothetical protein
VPPIRRWQEEPNYQRKHGKTVQTTIRQDSTTSPTDASDVNNVSSACPTYQQEKTFTSRRRVWQSFRSTCACLLPFAVPACYCRQTKNTPKLGRLGDAFTTLQDNLQSTKFDQWPPKIVHTNLVCNRCQAGGPLSRTRDQDQARLTEQVKHSWGSLPSSGAGAGLKRVVVLFFFAVANAATVVSI